MKIIRLCAIVMLLCATQTTVAQLSVRVPPTVNDLVQRLLGSGVSVSNVTLTSGILPQTGIFSSMSTVIPYDSGIVLTTGLSKSNATDKGLNGLASDEADNGFFLPGDPQLDILSGSATNDACVLEFDFVPLGDTVFFDYIFSSEEYPQFNCTPFNDYFAFYISGPGIVGSKNMAIIPGTNIGVSINSINSGVDGDPTDAVSCTGVFTNLYVNNIGGQHLTHNGLTVSLRAISGVTPCQTYHLKIAIADVTDDAGDSGVFLKSGSFNSNAAKLTYQGTLDLNNNQLYTAEGCSQGNLVLSLPTTRSTPSTFSLVTVGTATNGVDITPIPNTITIPPNALTVSIPFNAINDNIPEGAEVLKVYLTSPCNMSVFLDSVIINIRDYDTLNITPNSPAYACNTGTPLQLNAVGTYTTYTWDANPSLSATNIANPVATPTVFPSKYYCTTTLGTCQARDSITVLSKNILSQNSVNVNCGGNNTGAITLVPGPSFIRPLQFSLNGAANQPDSNFLNLAVGMYTVTLTDATNCVRTYNFNIIQAFPTISFTEVVTPPACNLSGSAVVTAMGGNPPYQYSNNGTTFFNSNMVSVVAGSNTLYVRDANGCIRSKTINVIALNTLTINNALATPAICSTNPTGIITATGNGGTSPYQYSLALNSGYQALNTFNVFEGVRKIYVKDAAGCLDSVTLTVPLTNNLVVNAGPNVTLCEGKTAQLTAASNADNNTWTPNVAINNATSLTPIVAPTVTTQYVLTGTKGNCTRADTMVVTVNPAPIADAGMDATICYGQSITLQGNGGSVYNWQPVAQLTNPTTATPTATPTIDSKFWTTVTDAIGCTSLNTDTVNITVTPPIVIIATPDTTISPNQPLQLNATGAPLYQWIPSAFLSNATIANPVANITSTSQQQYIVRGFNAAGCVGYDTVNVTIFKGPDIYVPTAFTPNNDGRNDFFFVKAVGLTSFNYIRVFNRWGQLVFDSKDPNRTWNGRTKNGAIVTGAYVWMVSAVDYLGKPIFKKGTVMVIQ